MASGKMNFIVIIAGALLALNLVLANDSIDVKNPVKSAAEDEITSLPGLNYTPNFKHYSGYLEADTEKNRFWHYWFVESQSNPSEDPLVLWLNGGPGCSSLLGLLTELGPYQITEDGQVVENKFSWNKNANIIFLESPAGVGFSYATDGSVVANDDSTAKQNHQALASFFKKFPQYQNRPLYLTGESYGGVYLPTLAVLVDQDDSMNLKGVAIGNGYLDANKLNEALIFFSYHHGLVGRTVWTGLTKYCCDGKAPARGECKFFDSDRSDKCGYYVKSAAETILNIGLNPYNLYDKCAQASETQQQQQDKPNQLGRKRSQVDEKYYFTSRETFDKSLLLHSFNITNTRQLQQLKQSTSRLFTTHESVRGDPPCTDDSIVINYLNRADVKKALHIPEQLKQQFSTCFDEIQYTMQYPDSPDGMAPFIKKLMRSQRKLNLIVYNGDTDMMCNFLGDEWFVDDLNAKVVSDYKPWFVNEQVAGFVKEFKGITYMTVRGSGHMVPTDKPAEALYMFQKHLLRI